MSYELRKMSAAGTVNPVSHHVVTSNQYNFVDVTKIESMFVVSLVLAGV